MTNFIVVAEYWHNKMKSFLLELKHTSHTCDYHDSITVFLDYVIYFSTFLFQTLAMNSEIISYKIKHIVSFAISIKFLKLF